MTPPERVVQTFEWDGMPGYVAIQTMDLEDLGDGRTKLVTTSLFHTIEERDGMLNSGMERGMNEKLRRPRSAARHLALNAGPARNAHPRPDGHLTEVGQTTGCRDRPASRWKRGLRR